MNRIAPYIEKFASPENLPISFYVNDRKVYGIPERFNPTVSEEKTGNITNITYVGNCPNCGLEIKSVVTKYDDFPVYEIVTYFTNKSDKNSPQLRQIQGFDGQFNGSEPYLYTNSGDYFSAHGYEVKEEYYVNQMWTRITPQTGRPCDQAFPYFKIQFEGHGLNIAIGWPAQWAADFSANLSGVALKAGQDITDLYLEPGEMIRTPKVTIMACEGNVNKGTNMWREWYFKYILPRIDGEPLKPMLCTSYNGGGEEFTKADEKNQIEYIRKNVETGLPYEAWWIDAGWYDCKFPNGEDHWYLTGNWYADKDRFPNGLKPVSDELKKHNMKLLLWFEPERVRKDTMIEKEHPEWLLNVECEDDGEWGISRNYLLNLGNKDCCDWLINHIDKLIKEYGVSIYRQDFNFPPIRFWRENESFDRQGINENKYVQGYLRFWDTLLERNPGLFIDSCSSGGRRNDLETLRRSVPLHPTDYAYGYHPIEQAFSRTLDTWIPYYRLLPSSWDIDGEYTPVTAIKSQAPDTFSRLTAFSPFFYPHFSLTPTEEDFKLVEAWKRAMKITLCGHFYPISKESRSDDNFFVNEYITPCGKKGYFRAIRNIKCETEAFTARPLGIVLEGDYELENGITGEKFIISAKDFAENGITIKLEKRKGALWFFTKI